MQPVNDDVAWLLRLGDSALILSQRLSEWSGHAPVLEEELATANVALDLLGHARMWLGEAVARGAAASSADDLAFLRAEGDFRNVLLVEQPNGDFAVTMVRQFLFDVAHRLELEALADGPDDVLAGMAAKAVREVRYHEERSAEWVIRLGDGTEESHRRTQQAADDLWMYSGELLMPSEAEARLVASGRMPDPAALAPRWLDTVEQVFGEATLAMPADIWMQSGGKSGVHTEHMGYLLAEMQHLPRSHPGARW